MTPGIRLATYHLERVQLLLDLLCEHRGEPVACGSFSTSVVLLTRPRVVEDDARRERRVAPRSARRSAGTALSLLPKPQSADEVVFVADSHRVAALVYSLVVGRARGARVGRVRDRWDARQVRGRVVAVYSKEIRIYKGRL